MGRLYGGAGALILVEGHEQLLETPLDLDQVMPGSYKGLLVLDRWCGLTPEAGNVTDLSSPDFGLPEYYRVSTQDLRSFKIHHSRLLRFLGNQLPLWESWAEQQWGASVIESVFDELKKRDNTSYNIAGLIFLANVRTYKTVGRCTSSTNHSAPTLAPGSLVHLVKDARWDESKHPRGGDPQIKKILLRTYHYQLTSVVRFCYTNCEVIVMARTVHNIRIDENVKREAANLYASLGLSLSDAINVFLRKSLMVQGFPFEVRYSFSPNAESLKAMNEVEEMIKTDSHRSFTSVEQMFAAMNADE
ncbi:MAG: type II toxin-antitoxin system RelB/DinJ family antitoxin [Gracilibacteraceae bacterium]|jgi:addiction module RelB/DinJ family antitoxin|nr:type II toxin-antitoxin system RelB/DinJ family antitoxin [Gracilibacteraceae bacterium]